MLRIANAQVKAVMERDVLELDHRLRFTFIFGTRIVSIYLL
jgi:hypothetical protein